MRRRSLPLLAAALLSWLAQARGSAASVDFSRDVLPILSEYCFQCHGPDEKARKAKLRLDTPEGALGKNAEGVAIITPGHGPRSELIRRIEATEPDEVMPPAKSKHPLAPGQIDILKRWVKEGAPWGRHWAFEKPVPPARPHLRNTAWPRNEIDLHVLRRLERDGLEPAAEAARGTLIRRLCLDLTGLPPKADDVAAFVADDSPEAYEKLVDRLLSSPHYGERMAWDWLDAARYADSNGYQGDGERTMWPWRDWVVSAFNENLRFDQFTVWQLAGDLLPNASQDHKLATGFLRNHMINGEGGRIPEENRVDYVMDMAETTGTVWLGLTFNCCRCHDHKFDPLTQRDYYGLFAFFNQTPVDGGGGNPQTKPVLELPTPAQEEKSSLVEERVKAGALVVDEFERRKFPRAEGQAINAWDNFKELPKEIQEFLRQEPLKRDAGRLEKLAAHWKTNDVEYVRVLDDFRKVIEERSQHLRTIPRVMVMEDLPKQRDTFVLFKGLYDKPKDKVNMAVPASLPPLPASAPTNRLGLAQWIVSPENPLTARVIVNRLWQQFFGIGLVKTAEDFGVQGEKPVNPELLDWLATEFIRSGWDVKHLCKLIVTSATYRQTSRATPDLIERDPQNRLFARGPRFRMPSWMLRDQALGASGLLVDKVGGKPVNPYQPSGVWEEATFGGKKYRQDTGEALYRRSLYTFWRRIIAPTLFFDSASRQTCTVKQPRTNTPLQALTTLNDVTYVEAARVLAERVLAETVEQPEARIELAFRRVLGRKPSAVESQLLAAALNRYEMQFQSDPDAAQHFLSIGEFKGNESLAVAPRAAYAMLCSMIMNLDEALTKE